MQHMIHDSHTLSYLLPDLLQKNFTDPNLYLDWNANTLFCYFSFRYVAAST